MKFIKDRPIGQKIGMIIGVLVVLLVITSLFAINRVKSIGYEMNTVYKEDIPLTALVSDITAKQLEKSLLLERALRIAGVSAAHETIGELSYSIRALTNDIDSEIKEGEAILRAAKGHALSSVLEIELARLEGVLFSIENEHVELDAKAEQILSKLESGEPVKDDETLALQEVEHQINKHLEDFLADVGRMTSNSMETALHHEESALVELVVLCLISSMVGIVLGAVMTRLITKPIKKAAEIAYQLSQGDLTVKVDTYSNDEAGQLLNAMKVMSERLHNMINEIASASEQLKGATSEVTTVTTQSALNLNTQADNLNEVVTAMNEMTVSIQDVASNAYKTVEITTDAEKHVRQGTDAVLVVDGSINDLAEEFQLTQKTVSKLDVETESVSAILDVITNIAEQTNLLALNAAIEAARAGEQGRGFAVVADEVRTLASRTQESIDEIHKMTVRLKTEASSSVKAMEQGHTKTQETVEVSGRAQSALMGLSKAVSDVNNMNLQIASAAEEQSTVSEQVNVSINRVSETARENSDGAKLVAQAAEEISVLSENLKEMIGQFKIA
ncbi:methyl-accepting chemotaxis protein [Marinomonas balearica]|uniref:Methyl-accepting chemotaxis sensory transducer with TarH sensor n=1 Tax=Marinomonas balearica TaxID=491947 RepID=A0A4R6MI19_9GAMM|nr:methyl-accepting chemotaxis protein [Marinomonas balearica]TDO99849.1 methyl-accepting chemotaxis sensory transducer with TarH sensor [Marinomonas balearica]